MLYRKYYLKFIYTSMLITCLGFSGNAQSFFLQNVNTGKLVKLDTGLTINYAIRLDSIYQYSTEDSIMEYSSKLVALTDTSMIMTDGIQVLFNELVYWQQTTRKKRKWRAAMAPIMVAGWGVFIRGVMMGVGEGIESKNAEWVPIQVGAGLVVGGLASIPFLKKDKIYFARQGWEIVQLNVE